MLYPLSYEGRSVVLPGRSLVAWLWSAGWLGRVLHGCRRGQCLMVLTGREGGRDLVIDLSS